MACGVEKSVLHCLCGFLTRSDWKKWFCHWPAESFRQHITKQKKTNTHLSQKRLHVVLRLVLLSTLNYHLGGAVKYVAVAKEPVSKFGAHPLTWICLYSSLAWRSAYSSIVIETKKQWHKDLQLKMWYLWHYLFVRYQAKDTSLLHNSISSLSAVPK